MSINENDDSYEVAAAVKHGVRRKRKRFIPTLFQLGTMIAAGVLITTLISIAAVRFIARPYLIGAQQAAVLSQKRAAFKQLSLENDQLARQSVYLNRPDGIEAAARNLGYLKPGEESLVIEPTPSSGATQQ